MPSMKMLWVLILGLATMVITRTSARSLASKITCSAGTFEVGQTASVTCYFHKDVQESRDGFDMTARYFNSPDNTTFNSIVNCNWFPNGTLHCLIKDGFVVRNKDYLTDHLTVDIPTFTERHTGVYKCHVIDDVATTEPCNLLTEIGDTFPQSAASDNVAYSILGGVLTGVVLLNVVVVVICRNKKSLQHTLRRLFRKRGRGQRDDGTEWQFKLFRSTSQTLADYKADSQGNTPMKKKTLPSTNSPSDNEEGGNGYQFKLIRSTRQILTDYEAESPENTPVFQTRASSTSVDSQGKPTHSLTDHEEPSVSRFNRNTTPVDYEGESPESMPLLPTQASDDSQGNATNSPSENEKLSLSKFNRSGSQTEADYKAESLKTKTSNHSDQKEPAQYTGPPRSRLAVAIGPNPLAKRVEVPKQQFNCGLGMARKPYPIKPTDGIKTRQRSYENVNFPMNKLKETSLKKVSKSEEGRENGRTNPKPEERTNEERKKGKDTV